MEALSFGPPQVSKWLLFDWDGAKHCQSTDTYNNIITKKRYMCCGILLSLHFTVYRYRHNMLRPLLSSFTNLQSIVG